MSSGSGRSTRRPPGRFNGSSPPLMHLTVKFLGPVDRDGVDRLQGVLGNVAAGRGPFRLSLSRGGLFTRYGQLATLLLDLPEREGGRREFQELAAAVDGACRSAGFRAAKTPLEHLASPQKPHVTIGHVRKKLDGASAEQLVALGVALGGPEPARATGRGGAGAGAPAQRPRRRPRVHSHGELAARGARAEQRGR